MLSIGYMLAIDFFKKKKKTLLCLHSSSQEIRSTEDIVDTD